MFDNRQLAFIKAIAREISSNSSIVSKTSLVKVGDSWKTVDKNSERILSAYLPSYWTEAGLVTCVLHNIVPSNRNGETIANYDLTYKKPGTREVWTQRFIYAVRDGRPKEIFKHESRRIV
ncbi:hypothetical protein [Agrobacterium tumefaciens]|uniref:hypothetical protein n=1 Tax=Agrobacterium tumefaciens TaxID=358 RepID=UPI000470D2FF